VGCVENISTVEGLLKELDAPGVTCVFGLLLEVGLIDYEQKSLIVTMAHFTNAGKVNEFGRGRLGVVAQQIDSGRKRCGVTTLCCNGDGNGKGLTHNKTVSRRFNELS
jgi:hypothetical protein